MKFVRLLLTILLVPVVIASGWSFFNLLLTLGRSVSESAMPFWAGIIVYFIFQGIFFKPIRTYVFGHELTHAIAGIMSGAWLKSFKVSSSGGSVVLTKTNIWIALAPYFIPIYTLLLVIAYWMASRFWQMSGFYPYFLFLTGFTLSFHLCLTYFAMSQEQSDLKQFGTVFSSEIILIVNCVMLALLFRILFPGAVDFQDFIADILKKTILIISFSGKQIRQLWMLLR
ncbi:MAG: hypothetical protein ABII64_06370 [Elusimicrobiota bacterium]